MEEHKLNARDAYSKAICDFLIDTLSDYYQIDIDINFFRAKRPTKEHCEVQNIFFYLVLKHSELSFYNISKKLHLEMKQGAIEHRVASIERNLKKKSDIFFYKQLKCTEDKLLEFIKSQNGE